MKKRILLITLMVAMLVCLFVISASAESVHANVDKSETVTLKDGTALNLFDADGDALIWYIDANSATGYSSIKAQANTVGGPYVQYYRSWNGTSHNASVYQLGTVSVTDASGNKFAANQIVVFNIMDDDVLINENGSVGKPVNCIASTFENCTNLEYAYLRLDTINIFDKTFMNCSNLKYVNLEDITTLLGIEGANAFNGCSSLFDNQTLDLSRTSIIQIGVNGTSKGGTFLGVPFKNVVLPQTLKIIGHYAFQTCKKLETITLPSSLETFGGNSNFKECTALTTVIGFENTAVTTIPSNLFYGCSSLENISLPSGLVTLGSSAFYKCSSLETITFPSTMTKIDGATNNNDNGTFEECTSLVSVHIPKSVIGIYGNAFTGCTALTSLTFEDRQKADGTYEPLTFYGWATFQKCTALTRADLPEGLTNVPNGAFASCSKLEYLYLPSTITSVTGNNNFSYTALTEVIGLENTQITTITHSMFRGVKTWKPDLIIVPNTVTKIETYGFADVGMKAIKLGNGVTTINNEAFTACLKLEAIYIPSSVSTLTLNNAMKDVSTRLIFTTAKTASNLTISSSVGVGKTETNVITYEQYLTGKDTTYATGTWIITGINTCDTFYDGVHTLDPEKSNACAGVCGTCQEIKQSANPVHVEKVVITFVDLAKAGTKVTTCDNENCPYHVSEALPAVFTYAGISADMKHQYVTVGYLINQESLKAYISTLADGVAFSYGFVATATTADVAINSTPIDATTGKVTASNMVQIDLSAQENIEKCAGLDFKMAGNFNQEKYLNANLGISLYTMTKTTSAGVDTFAVNYIVADGNDASKSVTTLTSFTFAEKISEQGE